MAPGISLSEDAISTLTCNLELNLKGMIRDIPPAQTSTIRREYCPSSLGQLDTLPAELLFLTLGLLDFKTLFRISRVSLRGKEVVEAFPPYQKVMEHAPQLLTALGKTRLLGYYSAPLILQTLRSDQCVSCFDYGAFFFLPTCERVCFECLHENRALWMITPTTAKRFFGLTERWLAQIPIMYSIPGSYSVRSLPSRRGRVLRLVSVKQAKKLAIEVHGSGHLGYFKPMYSTERKALNDYHDFWRYYEASLEPPGCDMSRLPSRANIGDDPYAGMASIRVPHLTESGADWGRLCRGCQVTYNCYRDGSLPQAVLFGLSPPRIDPDRPLSATLTRLRSRERFLEHVQHCYGARRLLKDLGEGLD
ncbi:hypothetical protein ACJ41O_000529 [Fusarium nematophilum]